MFWFVCARNYAIQDVTEQCDNVYMPDSYPDDFLAMHACCSTAAAAAGIACFPNCTNTGIPHAAQPVNMTALHTSWKSAAVSTACEGEGAGCPVDPFVQLATNCHAYCHACMGICEDPKLANTIICEGCYQKTNGFSCLPGCSKIFRPGMLFCLVHFVI